MTPLASIIICAGIGVIILIAAYWRTGIFRDLWCCITAPGLCETCRHHIPEADPEGCDKEMSTTGPIGRTIRKWFGCEGWCP